MTLINQHPGRLGALCLGLPQAPGQLSNQLLLIPRAQAASSTEEPRGSAGQGGARPVPADILTSVGTRRAGDSGQSRILWTLSPTLLSPLAPGDDSHPGSARPGRMPRQTDPSQHGPDGQRLSDGSCVLPAWAWGAKAQKGRLSAAPLCTHSPISAGIPTPSWLPEPCMLSSQVAVPTDATPFCRCLPHAGTSLKTAFLSFQSCQRSCMAPQLSSLHNAAFGDIGYTSYILNS